MMSKMCIQTGKILARNNMQLNIDRVAFSLFGIDIYWYAIIIITGIFIASYFAKKEFVRRGFDEDFIYDLLFVILPIGVIGARIYYVIFEWDYYGANPSQILNFRAGGLAIHGGIIFGVIALLVYSKVKEIPFFDLTDVLTPSLILAQGIGRWGNFVNGEAHGGPTDLPWAIIVDGIKVHPTFLYESVGDLLIFLFLINYRKNNPDKAKITSIYLMGYGILRFLVEGLRTDSLYLGSLRIAQVVSLIFVLIGVILLIYAKKKNFPPYFKKKKEIEKKEKIVKFK